MNNFYLKGLSCFGFVIYQTWLREDSRKKNREENLEFAADDKLLAGFLQEEHPLGLGESLLGVFFF